MRLLLLPILVLSACAPHKTFVTTEGDVSLKYDCAHFEPQAKTQAEGNAVMMRAVSAIRAAKERGDISLSRSLKLARDLRDVRRVEELIVMDECSR